MDKQRKTHLLECCRIHHLSLIGPVEITGSGRWGREL